VSQAFLLSAVFFYQALQNSALLSLPPPELPSSEQSAVLVENHQYDPKLFGITRDRDAIEPIIDAKAALLMDAKTQAVLYQKNAYVRLPIASITKIFLIMALLDGKPDLGKVITVDQYSADMPASKLYLRPGDKLTLHKLLQASLIASANDATMTLVQGAFGGVDKALEKVNKKVTDMGFINTHITSPLGFDVKDNYSTAFELAKAAHEVVKSYPTILDNTAQKRMVVTSEFGHEYEVKSTNLLLGSYLDLRGLKTGTTSAAGESFVSIGTYKERELITVVLNSPDRFQETKVLYEWAMKHYKF